MLPVRVQSGDCIGPDVIKTDGVRLTDNDLILSDVAMSVYEIGDVSNFHNVIGCEINEIDGGKVSLVSGGHD